MAVHGKPCNGDRPSIKYRFSPDEVASFELADIAHKEDVSTLSDSYKQSSKQSETKSTEILNTTDFLSAVGWIWNCANRPLSVFQPIAHLKHKDTDGEINVKSSIFADTKFFYVDLKSGSFFPHKVNSNSERIEVIEKKSLFESCKSIDRHPYVWKYISGNSHVPQESWKAEGLGVVGISCDLRKFYGGMSGKHFVELKYMANVTQFKNKKAAESFISKEMITSDNMEIEGTNCTSNLTKCKDPPSGETAERVENAQMYNSSLNSDYSHKDVAKLDSNGAVLRTSNSSLYSDYHIKTLSSGICVSEQLHTPNDDNMPDNGKGQFKVLVLEDEPATAPSLSVLDKPDHPLAKQRHAFAGALAGVFVSLCLHPVDTVKTVIQSHCVNQKSFSHIVRTIISERGLAGLYRGIASNIASSAPISAVYTFTYESVKGALLPILPEEHYSLAHCVAGGCASIATSFIFTPSERIKQQMQVGSHYQNCWNALVGILERGGLRSLYAGWGAVLCRNVPHSIIKFYTYESLKQFVSSSSESNAHPNTLQTLVCGGLAGSTAALFTTPFDVVKTKFQTQVPGSLGRYDGVLHALQEIAKHEGLKGLYRGLTPRLVMYISQGALFFASYEFFKSAFSLEVQKLHAQRIQSEQNVGNHLTSTSSSPKLKYLNS